MTGACDSGRLRRCLRLCSLTVWRTLLSGQQRQVSQWTWFIDSQGDGECHERGAGSQSDRPSAWRSAIDEGLNWKSQGLDAEKQPDARIMSPGATGEERSLQARQIRLKIEGKRRAVELRRETAREERREDDGLAS